MAAILVSNIQEKLESKHLPQAGALSPAPLAESVLESVAEDHWGIVYEIF